MKWMLVLVVLLGMFSCEKKEDGQQPGANNRPRMETREAVRISSEHDRKIATAYEELKSGSSKRERTGPLAGQDEGTITADLSKLIESSTLTPNSEIAGKAKEALIELLKRKSAEFYTMLSLLPPGYFSEDLVSQVFRGAEPGLEGLRAMMDKIKEPDLLKAALDGAFAHGREWQVGIAELENFEKMGLSRDVFESHLAEGYQSGIYSLDEVARNSTDKTNFIYNRLSGVLSSEQLKEYCMLVYKNGRKIDGSSLTSMGYRMFQSDGQNAVAWAQQLPEEAGKEAISGIFYEWTAANPHAASKYLGQMNEGLLKDRAIFGLVRNCVANNGLENVANWVVQIKDEKIRSETQALIQTASPVR